jgi:hypothetical protein
MEEFKAGVTIGFIVFLLLLLWDWVMKATHLGSGQ